MNSALFIDLIMKKIMNIVNALLLVVAMLLAGLLFSRKSFSCDFLNKIHNVLTSFLQIGINKDQEVSASIKFNKIAEYQYDNTDMVVYCPFPGTIMEVSNQQILLKFQNGYTGVIGNVLNIQVKKYDVINEDDVLGNFNEYFTMYFYNKDEIKSYEDII